MHVKNRLSRDQQFHRHLSHLLFIG